MPAPGTGTTRSPCRIAPGSESLSTSTACAGSATTGGRWRRDDVWHLVVSDAVWIAVVVSLGVTQALQIALLGAMNRARGPAEAAYISILGTLAGLTLALTLRSLTGSRPALPSPFDHPALTGAVALASGTLLALGLRGLPLGYAVTGLTAEPLLRATYRAALRKGAHPVLLPSFSEAQADLFSLASDEQLAFISPLERWMREEATVTIDVLASTNTRALSTVDPSRQSVWSRARKELRKSAFERAARGERRWSSTIFPTSAHAQDADMATDEFASFLEVACMLDRPDPIAAWRELSARQVRMIAWLRERGEF